MGIKATFGGGIINAKVAAFQMRVEAATLYMLKYLGESLVAYAREQHNYTDRTGNLTNSIGYVIVKKGKITDQGGFIQSGGGAKEGLKVANELAKKTTASFSLIVVAGMNYAAYVEAKGYNVILPAELKAKKDFPEAMRRLRESAKSKASEIFGSLPE
ncbi:MAG TPA: hypothetical protein DDW85_01560 [Porphyromonadaceae bacterium]|nr:hypothetical protein [Porphyromonadaceae bacterium]